MLNFCKMIGQAFQKANRVFRDAHVKGGVKGGENTGVYCHRRTFSMGTLGFKLSDFCCQILNTSLILLRYFVDILYRIVNLHYSRRHLIHTIGDNTG